MVSQTYKSQIMGVESKSACGASIFLHIFIQQKWPRPDNRRKMTQRIPNKRHGKKKCSFSWLVSDPAILNRLHYCLQKNIVLSKLTEKLSNAVINDCVHEYQFVCLTHIMKIWRKKFVFICSWSAIGIFVTVYTEILISQSLWESEK